MVAPCVAPSRVIQNDFCCFSGVISSHRPYNEIKLLSFFLRIYTLIAGWLQVTLLCAVINLIINGFGLLFYNLAILAFGNHNRSYFCLHLHFQLQVLTVMTRPSDINDVSDSGGLPVALQCRIVASLSAGEIPLCILVVAWRPISGESFQSRISKESSLIRKKFWYETESVSRIPCTRPF